jgi:uncharacterized protein (TIGR03435 family)
MAVYSPSERTCNHLGWPRRNRHRTYNSLYECAVLSDIDRPEVNLTNIEGSYDFRLDWAPLPARPTGGALVGDNIPDVAGGPTIFDTLGKQFGLKLEKQRRSMPVITVDHVERIPAQN